MGVENGWGRDPKSVKFCSKRRFALLLDTFPIGGGRGLVSPVLHSTFNASNGWSGTLDQSSYSSKKISMH